MGSVMMHRIVSLDEVSICNSKKRNHETMSINPSGSNTLNVEDESPMAQRRKRTRIMLEERLTRAAQNEKKDDSCIDQSQIQRQAATIEAVLFKQQQTDGPLPASNADDDSVTNQELNRNLILLLGRIVEHRDQRKCYSSCQLPKSSNAPSETPRNGLMMYDARQEALEKCLGKERYRQAKGIVQTIHQLAMDLTGKCYSYRTPKQISLIKGSKMPSPVRRLFCETSLRTIMNRTPIPLLPLQDWDKILSQAERHVKEYLEWVAHCEPPPPASAASCGTMEESSEYASSSPCAFCSTLTTEMERNATAIANEDNCMREKKKDLEHNPGSSIIYKNDE